MFRFTFVLSASLLVTQPALAIEEFNINGYSLGIIESEFLNKNKNAEISDEFNWNLMCNGEIITINNVSLKVYTESIGRRVYKYLFYDDNNKDGLMLHEIVYTSTEEVNEDDVVSSIEEKFAYIKKWIGGENSNHIYETYQEASGRTRIIYKPKRKSNQFGEMKLTNKRAYSLTLDILTSPTEENYNNLCVKFGIKLNKGLGF